MIRPIDHSISEQFNPLLKVFIKGSIDNFFIANLQDIYNKKKNTNKINSYELILAPRSIFIWRIK